MPPSRRLLVTKSQPLKLSLAELDVVRLRGEFCQLMDRVSSAVQHARYDLDAVVVDRFIVCASANGLESRVVAEPLHDGVRLCDRIRKATMGEENVRIVALVVEAVLDAPHPLEL